MLSSKLSSLILELARISWFSPLISSKGGSIISRIPILY